MKYFKLCFKEFKYNEKLSRDDNISKISNFFATQKPIYFFDYLKERSLKNINEESNLIENLEQSKGKKSTKINGNKFEYPETYLDLDTNFYNDREYKQYIKLINIFNFGRFHSYWLDYKERISYSIKFKEEDMNDKLNIFF